MNSEEIFDVFKQHYEAEYEIIGKSKLIRIIEAKLQNKDVTVFTSNMGSSFDIVETINIAGVIIATIKTLFELLDLYKSSSCERSVEEIKNDVLKELTDEEKLIINERKIIEIIQYKMKNK